MKTSSKRVAHAVELGDEQRDALLRRHNAMRVVVRDTRNADPLLIRDAAEQQHLFGMFGTMIIGDIGQRVQRGDGVTLAVMDDHVVITQGLPITTVTQVGSFYFVFITLAVKAEQRRRRSDSRPTGCTQLLAAPNSERLVHKRELWIIHTT